MKYILKLILCFINLTIAQICWSQNAYVDSLKNELNNTNLSTKAKFSLYNQLSEISRTSDQYKDANSYIDKQIALAKKENNTLELVKATVQKGIIYENQQMYNEAQSILDQLYALTIENKDPIVNSYVQYLQAYHYFNLNEYEKALKTIQNFLPKLEKMPEEFTLKSKANYFLYGIHANWNDAKNSILYAQKSLKFAEASGDKNLLVTAYANLGVAESLKYLESKSPKDLEILIATSKKAVEISQKFPNQVSKYNYAIALLNLTDYQANFSVQSSQIKEEMKQNCFKIIELSKNIPNAQNVSSGALGILSKLAIDENNIDVAEKYLLDANDILLTQNKKDYYALISISTELANLYDRKQNFQQAYEFQKKVTEYSNLLYDQGQAETSKKLEAQFQGKEKDLELKSLTEKAENIKKERILYIFLGIIGFVGAFFMFRSYHFKLRYSVGREKQLNAEKKETAIELKFKEEEQARLQAEQELMTLQQQKLQDEMLASQLHLDHKNQVLQSLKEKISTDSPINLKQILKEESLMDNNFEKTQFIIQETHPNFFKNLSEHSKQKLTPLDLKYCSYIYLGMDTKQIATILNVEPKSVRMTKYRLKQKFDLKKENELYTFFHQIIA